MSDPDGLLLPAPRELERTGEGPVAPGSTREALDPSLPPQGYALTLDEGGVRLHYADEAGRRYGRDTLRQIEAASPERLPGLRIRDWPDFAVRGLMLDVSRDRVPTRETLARLVGWLARLRLNHLELYTEHTFAYAGHDEVWRDASPLDAEDVRWLDGLCAEHGIELCANQNTFGHMGRWLRHAGYRERAEAPEGFRTRFGLTLPAGVLEPSEDNARFALDLPRNSTSSRLTPSPSSKVSSQPMCTRPLRKHARISRASERANSAFAGVGASTAGARRAPVGPSQPSGASARPR